MTRLSPKQPVLHADGVLALARREVLELALALQRPDKDDILAAELRVRWALKHADEALASPLWTTDPDDYRRVQRSAAEHLPETSRTPLTLETLAGVVEKLRAERPRAFVNANDMFLCGLDLDRLVLRNITLRSATVAHVDARAADLYGALACRAHISFSCFDSATLVTARFDRASLEDSDFAMADLTGSSWRETRAVRCCFSYSNFQNAALPGVVFTDCSFLNSWFRRPFTAPPEAMAGARFVRCDLRLTEWSGCDLSGVTFLDCKMRGMRGVVQGLEQAVIERPDLTDMDGREQIGTKADVVRMWASNEYSSVQRLSSS